MRVHDWLGAAIVGVLIAGCAGLRDPGSSDMKAATAPTGKLRVAFIPAVIFAGKDPKTGEYKGVVADLGNELARRIGVPFEPVVYSAVPALLAGAKSGEWDVVFAGITPERAAVIDFTAPYMELEHGFLARAGLAMTTVSDVDRAGIRVGVLEKSAADVLLSGTLKNAVLVRANAIADMYRLLESGKADVIATGKPGLFTVAARQPGSRVLDGRILVESIAMGVPKGRGAAAAYVGQFVEDAKKEGLVKSAIERAGLRGVVVAPLK